MSILQKIAANKIGIILLVFHWLLIASAVSFLSFHSYADEQNSFGFIIFLAIANLICDLPAILTAMLVCLPIYIFSEDTTDFWHATFLIGFFTVTFQWLFVGKAIGNFLNPKTIKPISLSLND